jgi:hypothetical protein
MAVRATAEINSQVALIKGEIQENKEKFQAILNASRPDLRESLTKFGNGINLGLPFGDLMNDSFYPFYQRLKKMYFDSKKYHEDRPDSQIRKDIYEGYAAFNKTYKVIQMGDKTLEDIANADRQLVSIQGLFEALAANLKSFSIPVVGIVVRYAM